MIPLPGMWAGRRLRALVLVLTLTWAVGLSAVPAAASEAPAPPAMQLAVEGEGGEGGELPGPEPDLDNTFAPEEFETPWTWWMGVMLTAVAVLSIGGVGLGYWLLVRRREES